MRTTVTIDPDVEAQLSRLIRERGITFKEALNSTLRVGLAAGERPARPRAYVLRTYALGARPDVDLDRAAHLDAATEDAEVMRKHALRK